MSLSAELFCGPHKLKATHICKLKGCASRLLCEGCFSEPHARQHSHSITSVNEFLFSQNKRRMELVAALEKKTQEIESFLGVYEADLKQSRKVVDADLGQIYQKFLEILNTANAFLKEQIYRDHTDLSAQCAALKRQLAALSAGVAQGDSSDFVVNFNREPLEPSVERLVAKNAELNHFDNDVNVLLHNLKKSADNRIIYKINKQSLELFEVLQEIFVEMTMSYFRNYRMLLVRPGLEHSFLSQFEKLKGKLLRELEHFKNPERDGPVPSALTLADIKSLLTAPRDLAAGEPCAFALPEATAQLLAKFVEFRPQGIKHPTFDKLQTRPSLAMEDGSLYEGQWDPQTGARHGFGRALLPDGSYYQGYWLYGKPSIVGRFVYPNGEIFEGILSKGKPNGKGVLLDAQGYKYEGSFRDGMRHGVGAEQTAERASYKGEFFRNLHQGHGVLHNPDQTVYVGDFFEGKYNGKGRFQWPNGEEYEGEWFEDKKHGYGKYVYADGRVYDGDFVDDAPHGYGVLTLANGTSLKAFWNRGDPTGFGLKTDKDSRASLIFEQGDAHLRDPDLSLIAA